MDGQASAAEAYSNEPPAARAIRLLGAKRIAAKCDLSTDAVWKWPKRASGTIPNEHQANVHELAQDLGVPLTAAEIIGVVEPPCPEAGRS